MVTRLTSNKEGKGKGGKGNGNNIRVVGNKEGNGDSGKSNGNGNKGGGLAPATKRVMVTATRGASKQQQRQ